MTRSERLNAYVTKTASEEVVWGFNDCTAWAASWAKLEAGRDIIMPHYKGETQARLMLSRKPLVDWADEALSSSGFFPCLGNPACGDIGVILLSTCQVSVIFVHGGLALWKGTQAVSVIRPETVLKSWEVPSRD